MTGAGATLRVGVDIGGTFTDLVVLDGAGRVLVRKVPSTVDDYTRGIVAGLAELLAGQGLAAGAVGEVVHGTTIAANAILERRGARTGLITTRGFRDALEIRRLRVPRLYDPGWRKPPPLVERYLRVEVDERIAHTGEVRRPLDRDSVRAAVARLLAEGVEAVAVCLLNSYANPAHEREIGRYLAEAAPALAVSLSIEVLPEIREYERTSTTVVNAYVTPVVRDYLTGLDAGLAALGVAAPVRIMQSNGGLMSAAAAAARPIHMIESGPAAGVVGARELARTLGLADVITVDIGGTTAKAAMIEGGEVSRAGEIEVGGGIIEGARLLKGSGYLVRTPSIDLAEVGAGGGSIVWLDAGGALRVGPHSAGASPGPVCYGLGGHEPTLTDANVVLGYLNPDYLTGGSLRLDADLARRAVAEQVARPLGLSLEAAAYGAHVIATAGMIRAIRAVSSERGRDPRRYVLCAFGGNGPLVAAGLAAALEMSEVVIPPLPGLFSSLGLLYGRHEHHLSRSLLRRLDEADPAEIGRAYAALEAEALAQARAEGGGAVTLERAADLRYFGQSFELTVPVAGGALTAADLADLAEAFGREHARTYGHRGGREDAVDLVTLRLTARRDEAGARPPERLLLDGWRPAGGERRAYFGPDHGWLATPVVGRADVPATPSAGPLIVEEYDATTVVPPGVRVWRDGDGNLRLVMRDA